MDITLEPTMSYVVGAKQAHKDVSVYTDTLLVEIPVALEYNGISHVVLMSTPENLEDLALGFSLSEGIIHDERELYDVEIQNSSFGVTMKMQISSQRFSALKSKHRNMAGSSGCGICGIQSLQQISPVTSNVFPKDIADSAIEKAVMNIKDHQALRLETGSSHGAAWCSKDGAIQLLREDVGRHNALDKLIGARLKHSETDADGFVLLSSRIGYELVQKCAQAKIGTLVAISAATSLAAQIAQNINMTLIGFARDQQYVIYNKGSATLSSTCSPTLSSTLCSTLCSTMSPTAINETR